jgi:hypothetical protein
MESKRSEFLPPEEMEWDWNKTVLNLLLLKTWEKIEAVLNLFLLMTWEKIKEFSPAEEMGKRSKLC